MSAATTSPALVLGRTCRAEWTRLWTVKATWWLVAAATVAMVGLGLIAGNDAAGDVVPPVGEPAWVAPSIAALPDPARPAGARAARRHRGLRHRRHRADAAVDAASYDPLRGTRTRRRRDGDPRRDAPRGRLRGRSPRDGGGHPHACRSTRASTWSARPGSSSAPARPSPPGWGSRSGARPAPSSPSSCSCCSCRSRCRSSPTSGCSTWPRSCPAPARSSC